MAKHEPRPGDDPTNGDAAHEPVQQSTEDVSVEAASAEAVAPDESEQVQEQPEEQPATTQPRLVTSTRRRVARRPAGPPAAVAEPEHGPVATVTVGRPDAGPTEPDTDLDTQPDTEPDTQPDIQPETGLEAGDPGDEDGSGHLEQPHVPVKKRGRRR
jgi:ribonuclease E